jgi:hypothetical protein
MAGTILQISVENVKLSFGLAFAQLNDLVENTGDVRNER